MTSNFKASQCGSEKKKSRKVIILGEKIKTLDNLPVGISVRIIIIITSWFGESPVPTSNIFTSPSIFFLVFLCLVYQKDGI
jgi:hypothetical protein